MLMPFDITTQPGRLMLGVVYDRLYKFFKEHDEHAQHDSLVQTILQRIIKADANDPILLMIRIVDGAIVGHILMSIEQDFGVPVVFVHQAEFDTGFTQPEERQEWLSIVKDFGRQYNAHRIVLMTKRHPRTFEKNYGFKVHRTIMVKDIQPMAIAVGSNGYLLAEGQ